METINMYHRHVLYAQFNNEQMQSQRGGRTVL